MLKPLLVAGACMLAVPALAQTVGSSGAADTANMDTHAATTTSFDASTHGNAMGMSDTTSDTSTSASYSTQGSATWSDTASPVMTAASGMTIQPGNTNPERDARGIAVISAQAFVPAGWNGIAGTAVGGPVEGGEANYPACSASVTDNCLQTYERGRR